MIGDRCPRCSSPLVTVDEETPWCERCEWNLGAFIPPEEMLAILRPLARAEHALGYRLNRRLVHRLTGRELDRPRAGLAYAGLLAVSGIVLAFCLWLIGTGIWFTFRYPNGFLFGPLLILLGVGMRPRLGSERAALRGVTRLTEASAPELFALIRQVAREIGAPLPDVVGVALSFNASTAIVGWRRHRVLIIGLPLWESLRPQERVGLLGHELGHFVNGDSTRGLLVQPALDGIGRLADMLRPNQAYAAAGMWAVLFVPLVATASYTLWLIHLAVNAVGSQEHRRAEYFADALGARVAGSDAAASMFDVQICRGVIIRSAQRWAKTAEQSVDWHRFASHTRTTEAGQMGLRRQLTSRTDASIFASHPPAGLRHRMLLAAPHRVASVVLTETAAKRIDAELAERSSRYTAMLAGRV